MSLFLYCKNPCLGIWRTLGKHFLPPASCGIMVPAKSSSNTGRSGSRLPRSQVNMEDEAKLCSPICSTLEALVGWRAVGPRPGEELGPFSSLALAGGMPLFWCISLIDLRSILLRYSGFLRIQKARMDQMGSRPPTSDRGSCFWCKFGSGNGFGASSLSNHCTHHCC